MIEVTRREVGAIGSYRSFLTASYFLSDKNLSTKEKSLYQPISPAETQLKTYVLGEITGIDNWVRVTGGDKEKSEASLILPYHAIGLEDRYRTIRSVAQAEATKTLKPLFQTISHGQKPSTGIFTDTEPDCWMITVRAQHPLDCVHECCPFPMMIPVAISTYGVSEGAEVRVYVRAKTSGPRMDWDVVD